MAFNSKNTGDINPILVAFRKRGDKLTLWLRACSDGTFVRQGYTDAHIQHAEKVITHLLNLRYLHLADCTTDTCNLHP